MKVLPEGALPVGVDVERRFQSMLSAPTAIKLALADQMEAAGGAMEWAQGAAARAEQARLVTEAAIDQQNARPATTGLASRVRSQRD